MRQPGDRQRSTTSSTRSTTLVGNVNLDAFGTNMDAIAFAVLSLAYSTEDVNGVSGKAVPGGASLKLPDPGGPEGTVGSLGGGHAHDHEDR